MKYIKRLIFSTVYFLFLFTLNGQDHYTYKSGDPNGINKWYMGRQIAQVMSHYGIDWLERPEREFEENTSLLLKNLGLTPGMNIADIGAGSGYYSTRLSKLIGNGKVYAVDVEPEMLEYLNNRIKKEKYSNIITVLGTETSISLPNESLDMILLVDVYHEFSYPKEMGSTMYRLLKPNGKIVLVEFRSEDNSVPIKTIHKMSEKQAIKEFKEVGFQMEKNISNLPWQHCMIYTKKK